MTAPDSHLRDMVALALFEFVKVHGDRKTLRNRPTNESLNHGQAFGEDAHEQF